MGSEWSEEFLEDLADEITVGFVGSMTSEYVEKGIPFLRSKNVDPLTINTDDLKFISHEFDQRIVKSHLQPGDVVIVRTGKPGTCAVVPKWLPEANCSDLVIVRCNSKIDSHFLAYYVNEAAAGHVNAHLVGAVQQHFNVASARELRVHLPPTTEQARIVNVLRAFDKKIELNRQTNQTLESMAQTLFKSWFVDFDPVIDNALAAGNEIPEPLAAKAAARRALQEQGADKTNRPHTLPEHIRRLFPSRFQFTEELGWIPEGWEVNTLKSVTTELRRGISPKYVDEGGIRVVNQKCIRNHVVNMTPARRHDPSKKTVDGRLISIGDVLVNSTGVGTLGRIAQVYSLDEPTVVDSHVTVVRPNTEVFKPYVFGRLMLSIERSVEALGMGSTGQTELSRTDLGAHPVVTPPLEIQGWAEELIKRCADKISFNAKQSETLIASRDALLPKLLSGELRIPEAEKILDEALV